MANLTGPHMLIQTEHLAAMAAERDAARQERDDEYRRHDRTRDDLAQALRERDEAIAGAHLQGGWRREAEAERDEAREVARRAVNRVEALEDEVAASSRDVEVWREACPWLNAEEE